MKRPASSSACSTPSSPISPGTSRSPANNLLPHLVSNVRASHFPNLRALDLETQTNTWDTTFNLLLAISQHPKLSLRRFSLSVTWGLSVTRVDPDRYSLEHLSSFTNLENVQISGSEWRLGWLTPLDIIIPSTSTLTKLSLLISNSSSGNDWSIEPLESWLSEHKIHSFPVLKHLVIFDKALIESSLILFARVMPLLSTLELHGNRYYEQVCDTRGILEELR